MSEGAWPPSPRQSLPVGMVGSPVRPAGWCADTDLREAARWAAGSDVAKERHDSRGFKEGLLRKGYGLQKVPTEGAHRLVGRAEPSGWSESPAVPAQGTAEFHMHTLKRLRPEWM